MIYNNCVEKRAFNKQTIVNSFGGKCQLCGYNKCLGALTFHHINPKEKEFNISKFAGNNKISYEQLLELTKCCLVCSNCHAEIHAKMHLDELKDLIIPDLKDLID